MKLWMFRCKDVSHKVSLSMDAALPFHQRMAIWMHLLMCRYCFRFRKQLMILRKLSCVTGHDPGDAPPQVTLSAESRARIKKRLYAFSETTKF